MSSKYYRKALAKVKPKTRKSVRLQYNFLMYKNKREASNEIIEILYYSILIEITKWRIKYLQRRKS